MNSKGIDCLGDNGVCIPISTHSVKSVKKKTRADVIRSMNDEELAEFLEKIVSGSRDVIGINCGNSKCENWKCTECIGRWLQSEAE